MVEPKASKVWIEGRVVDGDEARVSVFDHGLLYGDGVFEGMRIYEGGIFRLADHLKRLQSGMRGLGLELPGGLAFVEGVVVETAQAYARNEGYIRLLVTRGRGAIGVDPTTCGEPQLLCIVTGLTLYPEAKMASGIDMVTASLRRPPADTVDPAIKSLNYLNNVLAKREARLQGADEALLLNVRGTVAEASVANLFIVRDDVLLTPPVSDGALPGITRASIMTLAQRLGISCCERSLGRQDLFGADEVFLTGSGARIVPVARFDGVEIGSSGWGSLTLRLSEAFSEFVGEHITPLA